MLTCRQITELVTDYDEGSLSFAAGVRFRLHVTMCRNCRRYVRQLRATVAALGLLPPPEVPAELEEELLEGFDRWSRTRGA